MSIKSRVDRLEEGHIPEREPTAIENEIFGPSYRPGALKSGWLVAAIHSANEYEKRGKEYGSN